jgi:hypothetical protein
MPIAYLDVPRGADLDRKAELVRGIYEGLHEAFPFPDDVRIFLREWPTDCVSQNGHLGSEPARPVFTMHVPRGVAAEVKRKMLKKIHAAIAAAYPLPDIMTFIVEHPLELVAVDGALLADNQQRVEEQAAVYG